MKDYSDNPFRGIVIGLFLVVLFFWGPLFWWVWVR